MTLVFLVLLFSLSKRIYSGNNLNLFGRTEPDWQLITFAPLAPSSLTLYQHLLAVFNFIPFIFNP